MATGGHFVCPKITLSHFSPCQINTHIFFLYKNGQLRPFWMLENHFRLHLSPFQINMQLSFFLFFPQNGCEKITFDGICHHFRSIRNLFWKFSHKLAENYFRRPVWKITFHRISRHFRLIHNFFYDLFCAQNGCLEIWIGLHCSSFQINTQL